MFARQRDAKTVSNVVSARQMVQYSSNHAYSYIYKFTYIHLYMNIALYYVHVFIYIYILHVCVYQ